METKEEVTLTGMVRETPVRSCLYTLVPVALAVAQLLNSYFHGLPWLASVPFAVVLIGYACLSTQYNLTQLRRRKLEVAAYDVAD